MYGMWHRSRAHLDMVKEATLDHLAQVTQEFVSAPCTLSMDKWHRQGAFAVVQDFLPQRRYADNLY